MTFELSLKFLLAHTFQKDRFSLIFISSNDFEVNQILWYRGKNTIIHHSLSYAHSLLFDNRTFVFSVFCTCLYSINLFWIVNINLNIAFQRRSRCNRNFSRVRQLKIQSLQMFFECFLISSHNLFECFRLAVEI